MKHSVWTSVTGSLVYATPETFYKSCGHDLFVIVA